MNTFPLKKAKLIPLLKEQSPNDKVEPSNKRQISIIQEVKEKIPKKKKNINKSTLDFKNIRTMNVHKIQNNKSANFFNFK